VVALQDPAFFHAVPLFRYLQPSATAASCAAKAEIANCPSCDAGWRYFKPVADAMVLMIEELITQGGKELNQLRTYLQQKKGYHIGPVTILYKSKQGVPPTKLTF